MSKKVYLRRKSSKTPRAETLLQVYIAGAVRPNHNLEPLAEAPCIMTEGGRVNILLFDLSPDKEQAKSLEKILIYSVRWLYYQ